MPVSVKADGVLIPLGGRGRCRVLIKNAAGIDEDPTSLKLQITSTMGGDLGSFEYSVDPRVVKLATGSYYIDLGDVSPNLETNAERTLILNWTAEMADGTLENIVQNARCVSPLVLSKLPDFKLLIDKSRKLVDVNNECFLGYTDDQLLSYLEGGVSTINMYQPGGIYWSLSSYPWGTFGQLALESGLLIGVMSQQLFAVDTDIPNYSDQGTSFVIQHQPALASFFTQVAQRLDKMIPMMKLNFVSSGSLHVQMGGTYRFQALMDASPSGALFRNIMFKV